MFIKIDKVFSKLLKNRLFVQVFCGLDGSDFDNFLLSEPKWTKFGLHVNTAVAFEDNK